MKLAHWFRAPRLVLTLFVSLMALCALALAWLGWQVLVQDRAVEAQRRQEQLESAADRAVAAMERAIAAADVDVAVAANGQTEMTPAGRLAYSPVEAAPTVTGLAGFAEAEALEFSGRDRAQAADAYRRLARSDDAQVRVEALVRLARVLRREGKSAQALQTYTAIEQLGGIRIAGMPAGLVARAARCSVLADRGDQLAARREAAALWADLTAGKWILTKATLETYMNELRGIAPDVRLPVDWDERMTLAAAAQWAFTQPSAKGRAAFGIDGQPVSVSWDRTGRPASAGPTGGPWTARLIGPSTWRALWTRVERETNAVVRVTDADGRLLHGSAVLQKQAAYRAANATGLPWSITAAIAADAPSAAWTARRRLLIAGLFVFAVLLGAGSFLVVRGIGHELAVARLQSDFVAAVSHEFRTPLTSIRQLTEMLARGRVESDSDKQRTYELMLGESDRLRRLVESLLDFGRMQARAYEFRSEPLAIAEMTRAVAAQFQETVRHTGYVIDFSGPVEDVCIRGDREALGGALWNLLDNAVKYSPDERQVQVAVSRSNGNVEVSVRDRGSGIVDRDLRHVFGKFYRGANARAAGTKGTGIGLAMVKEIVEAHGGTVRVRSEPGRGSEFRMVLPCHES